MMRATWKGHLIAESSSTVVVEGNHYFPPASILKGVLAANQETSLCPWKGTATYFDVVVGGKTNRSAAWTYQSPSRAAEEIRDHIAFWRGVEVREELA